MKVAISLQTKDRVQQVKRILPALHQPDRFDLFWCDGSATEAGQCLPAERAYRAYANLTAGPDAAIVFALAVMLAAPEQYRHIGLCEDDILFMDSSWFDRTMELFGVGERDGLSVGAVSARAYQDRVLVQRSGYAVMHNLGAGMVIFTRRAATLVLHHYATRWSTFNRQVFATLAGIDIGAFWAFRGASHMICSDWGWDAVLAGHGLASLALVPSPVEMIGQNPPLEQQGLCVASTAVEARRDDRAFERFKLRTSWVRDGKFRLPPFVFARDDAGNTYVYPHQLRQVFGRQSGWKTRWSLGFGPFLLQAGRVEAELNFSVSGPLAVLVSGPPEQSGSVRVRDTATGWEITTELQPESTHGVLPIDIPAGPSWRAVTVEALTAGITFWGAQCRDAQPYDPTTQFDYRALAIGP